MLSDVTVHFFQKNDLRYYSIFKVKQFLSNPRARASRYQRRDPELGSDSGLMLRNPET